MIAPLAWLLALMINAEGESRYLVPAAGADDEYPPLRALPTGEQKPAELEVSAKFLGRMRYAQLTFGSPGTKPVTLAVDEISAAEVDLYADVNRTGTIAAGNKLKREQGMWRFSVDAQVLKGKETFAANRSLVVKYQRFTRSLAIATRGHIEGTLQVAGKKMHYRRFDGDANGLFNDPADQLWLDLDGDGRFAPASERFSCGRCFTWTRNALPSVPTLWAKSSPSHRSWAKVPWRCAFRNRSWRDTSPTGPSRSRARTAPSSRSAATRPKRRPLPIPIVSTLLTSNSKTSAIGSGVSFSWIKPWTRPLAGIGWTRTDN